MKRRNRFRAAGLGLVVMAAMYASPSSVAYNTWSDRHLTYGVVGQKYWLDQTAVDNNEGAILDGVAAWNATSTPVSYSRTTVKSSSRLDWYRISTNDSACAVARHFVDTTNVNGADGVPESNWWWGRVNIRPQLKTPAACGPATHREGVLAHEMGHVMGLAHVNGGANRLMRTDISSLDNVNTPRQDDIDGINHLY